MRDHVTLVLPLFVASWLCCHVLRWIVMLNCVLFCIIRFRVKRKSNRVVFCGCSAPSCDIHVEQYSCVCVCASVCPKHVHLWTNRFYSAVLQTGWCNGLNSKVKVQ